MRSFVYITLAVLIGSVAAVPSKRDAEEGGATGAPDTETNPFMEAFSNFMNQINTGEGEPAREEGGGGMFSMPTMPAMPEMPTVPAMPEMPTMPAMPEMPGGGEGGERK